MKLFCKLIKTTVTGWQGINIKEKYVLFNFLNNFKKFSFQYIKQFYCYKLIIKI